ncbi:uncharacterized protein RSE6_05610 [Rhynchosporium secalis]|uniref:Uncharacterized protein n=1 Tax=Rhynchosporium secalis TaxID=38038 RepID=A0A1E1M883_RHYSE|nr:uncharacterized protein RSE6_05610 [Rhynchosporium secalis]
MLTNNGSAAERGPVTPEPAEGRYGKDLQCVDEYLFKIEVEVTKSKHQVSSNFARRMPEDIADLRTGEKHPKFSYK